MESSQKSDVMQFLLVNPSGGICPFSLSLSQCIHTSSLLELSFVPLDHRSSGSCSWAAAEGTWATKGGRKKHKESKGRKLGQKRHCYAPWWWQEPAGWEERMTAIRLAGNSQALLNTTTADTWPSSEDRTEPIKHFEGQSLG